VTSTVRHAVLTLCFGLLALGSAGAQGGKSPARAGFAAGVGATYGNLMGGDFNGSKAAAGFDANLGVVLRRWELGVGYDRTNHRHADTDGDYVVSNVYFEPRLLFPSAYRWTPYGAARIGRAMASYQGVVGITDKATGYIAGVGAGLVWPLARHFQADAAAHYDRLSHDYGTGGYADAEKGGRTSLRVGVRYASGR
jgi:hypothetical protein